MESYWKFFRRTALVYLLLTIAHSQNIEFLNVNATAPASLTTTLLQNATWNSTFANYTTSSTEVALGSNNTALAQTISKESDTNITSLLHGKLDAIIKKGVACFHPKWVNTVVDFKNHRWYQLGDTPAIVYPFCSKWDGLGNWLGLYFNEAACALLAGAHMLSPPVDVGWTPANTTGQHEKFYEAIPKVVVNPHPVSYAKAQENMETVCRCPRYCWDDPNAAMFKTTPWIGSIVRKAISAYLETVNVSTGTLLSPNIDISSVPFGTYLPLIPDVAIQYRCGDNMGYGKIGYGVLPFRAFLKLIPSNAKYIYVMTDPPARAWGHPYVHHCQGITHWLFDYLTKHWPAAIVVVKKGGDMYLDLARLAFANTTICSASTFCLWPAMANNGSAVYYPKTNLIGVPPGDYKINDHFTWITDPPLITDVWRPWYLIEYALNSLPVNSKDVERHTVKGSGRAVYYVINQTKYAFPNGDTFEGLGFDWNDVWYLTDNDLSVFPAGPDIPGCDAKSCIGSPFFNPYKGSEHIPQVIS